MITELVALGLKVLDKVLPDPVAKQEAQYKLLELAQRGELAQLEAETQLALAQSATNQTEAASSDPFVRRWRPAVGWVCCMGLAYQYVAAPLLGWLSLSAGWQVPPPLDLDDLVTLLVGLLGLGSLRTIEKTKGVA